MIVPILNDLELYSKVTTLLMSASLGGFIDRFNEFRSGAATSTGDSGEVPAPCSTTTQAQDGGLASESALPPKQTEAVSSVSPTINPCFAGMGKLPASLLFSVGLY